MHDFEHVPDTVNTWEVGDMQLVTNKLEVTCLASHWFYFVVFVLDVVVFGVSSHIRTRRSTVAQFKRSKFKVTEA